MALIESQLAPMRERYAELIAHPERIEEVLQAGAHKARAVAKPLLAELRHAVGLRPMLAGAPARAKTPRGADKAAVPVFKQYQENGRFLFKLSTPQNKLLLQSTALADPREAGGWVKRLKTEGAAALDGAPIAWGESADRATVEAALTELVAANL